MDIEYLFFMRSTNRMSCTINRILYKFKKCQKNVLITRNPETLGPWWESLLCAIFLISFLITYGLNSLEDRVFYVGLVIRFGIGGIPGGCNLLFWFSTIFYFIYDYFWSELRVEDSPWRNCILGQSRCSDGQIYLWWGWIWHCGLIIVVIQC